MQEEINKLNQESPLVELFTLDCTQLGGAAYNFTPHFGEGGVLYFNSTAYQSIPIISDGWEMTSSGAQPRPTLSLSNVNNVLLNAVITLGDIVGAKVTRIRTMAKFLDEASFPRRNVLNYSKSLTSGASGYTRGTGLTVTDGVLAPDGSLTAVRLAGLEGTVTSATGTVIYSNLVSTTLPNTPYIFSLWVKPVTTGTVRLRLTMFTNIGGYVTETSVSVLLTAGVDGWTRVELPFTTGPTVASCKVVVGDNGTGSPTMDVWGAQVEQGTVPTPLQETTTTHQPYANINSFLTPDYYTVEQKSEHTSEMITWQLSSVLDRFGTMLPRRQITRDKFPGVGRQRGAW